VHSTKTNSGAEKDFVSGYQVLFVVIFIFCFSISLSHYAQCCAQYFVSSPWFCNCYAHGEAIMRSTEALRFGSRRGEDGTPENMLAALKISKSLRFCGILFVPVASSGDSLRMMAHGGRRSA
jgi:hypothetical protein